MYSPRTAAAAQDALRTTLQVIAALREELGLGESPQSPGEVAPYAFIDDMPIPAPVGHRSPWHVAPQAETDSVAIPKPSRGALRYYPTEETDEDEAWSEDDVPRSPGEVGALRGDSSFRGFDDVPIPAPRPIAEEEIDAMLFAEYEKEVEEHDDATLVHTASGRLIRKANSLIEESEQKMWQLTEDRVQRDLEEIERELEEQESEDDGATLVHTASGRLISKAKWLIEDSQQKMMQLAEDGLREELQMADADLEAWESLGNYADGFSPRPGWNKLEQAEEFLAEGDVFLEEQQGFAGSGDTGDQYEPSPALAPEEREAYLKWQQQNAEFEDDAAQFLDSHIQAQQAFADAAEGLRNPSFGMGTFPRPTQLNGPVPLGQRPRPSGENSTRVEATALAAVQSEIAALRAELGVAQAGL